MITSHIRFFQFLFFLIFFSFQIIASPSKPKYISRAYNSSDGLSHNIVSSILQDSRGFLWIGTYRGLDMYDGKNFHNFRMTNGLAADAVRSLFVDEMDRIWVGTELGLNVLENGKVQNQEKYPFLSSLSGKNIQAIHRHSKGKLYIGTTKGLFLVLDEKQPQMHVLIDNQIITTIYSSQGSEEIWVGTEKDGIYRIGSDSIPERIGIKDEVVSIGEEGMGRILISYKKSGVKRYVYEEGEVKDSFSTNHNFLKDYYYICKSPLNQKVYYLSRKGKSYLYEDGHYVDYRIENVNHCFIDREGIIWVGTYGSGLLKYYEKRITSFTKADGLGDGVVRYVYKDRGNRVWLGTQSDAVQFYDGKFKPPFHGKPISQVRTIVEDSYSRVWFGSSAGLVYLNPKKRRILSELKNDAVKEMKVYSLIEHGKFLFVLTSDKEVIHFLAQDLSFQGIVKIEALDNNELVWKLIKDRDGKLYLQSSSHVRQFNEDENNPGFNSLIKQSDVSELSKFQVFLPIKQDYYIFGDDKLVILKDGQKEVITKEKGLPDGQIFSLILDENERLWMGTSRGLVSYFNNHISVYNKYDGLASDFCNFNSIYSDHENIYVGTSEGLSIIKKDMNVKNEVKPKVFFISIKVNDEEPISIEEIRPFRYHQNTIQLTAANLSLLVPERNRYRFFRQYENEEEKESVWDHDGVITYYNLKPGRYKFRVEAENNDGVRSEKSNTIEIIIEEAFWMRWYFLLLSFFLISVSLYGLYRYKVYRIKQENEKLDHLVKQRTRELSEEKEVSEKLLLNILPKNIAERLKGGEETIADSFVNVSVLFADIVGFTKLSQVVSPEELVAKLNDLFRRFDELSLKIGVEKIKTIGDCYMAVAGLPEVKEDHAFLAMKLAVGMLKAIDDFNEHYGVDLSIRIGINSGEVVAGVIGKHKFIYDLWGDAVNTASRMESHGVPGKIHITKSTYEFLRKQYHFISRGELEIKGKGKMETFLWEA